MRVIIGYLRPFAKRMGLGFLIKVAGTMAELLLPYLLSYILKDVVARKSMEEILLYGGIMILFAALALACNIIANRMAARVSCDFSERVRQDLFDRTLHLSSAQCDRFTVASLESRITTDTYNVHNFVSMMQRMGVRAPILLIGGVLITLLMDSYLSLVMLATLPLIFVTVYLISRKGVPLYTRVQKAVDGMIRIVREDAGGIRVIKALSRTEHEHARYDRANRELVGCETRAGVTMGAVNPVMTLLMNGGIVGVVALSAGRVADGLSDPETVIAFMQYFTLISMAMMSVTRIFVMYTKCAASARRIAEVLQAPEDLPVMAEDGKGPAGRIVFDHVSFSYAGRAHDVEDISFTVPAGGSLGIIGPTGSGKSTIIRLMLRLYDADSGRIYIDGRDVRSIPGPELYAMFGTAMQQDFLYADTVEENIRFGREIGRESMEEAARIAQADGFIRSFADGYGHELAQKGANLSGGQKQRLLISRALAGRPEILVLDDSSSALDYRTDAALRRALASERGECTVVTVAQRVSSVKNCDCILVLEEGRIIGSGRHEELLESCAAYREISESQMGGAIVD